jgi:hypothetical protein
MMTFMPDSWRLWAEAKRIMDAAAAADWDRQYDPDNPHFPYVEVVWRTDVRLA